MREAEVVAARLHAVVGAQRVVAPGQVLGRVAVEIAEGGREAVAAVLARRPAERPQGVLQPAGQRDVAFAPEHDVGVLEARVGQPEMVQPVVERLAGDGDGELAHVGEVRQAEPPRHMGLREHHLPLRPVHGPPVAHPALEGAADPLAEGAGEGAIEFVQHRDRLEARRRLQQRHDEAVPNQCQRVLPRPPMPRLPPLRGRARIALDPACGGDRDARAGGRDGLGGGPADVHVQPHLPIRDVSARHRPSP